jgi:hypothetical protein
LATPGLRRLPRLLAQHHRLLEVPTAIADRLPPRDTALAVDLVTRLLAVCAAQCVA